MKTRKSLHLLAALAAILAPRLSAQVTTFSWPHDAGQAVLSDKYDVFVRMGAGPEQPLEVLMSNAIPEGDFRETEITGRTFSFVSVDYDAATGPGLTFRIVKKFGNAASAITLHPQSYGLTPTSASGLHTTFTVNANNRYLSVNFDSADNRTSPNQWIKHMLCIFIDPPETGKPARNGPGVVVYNSTTPAASLNAATTIFVPAGYHNFRNYTGGTAAISDGTLILQNGQTLYLEGGAFVDGLITRQAQGNSFQKILGRGVLSGRLFPWYDKPGYTGPTYHQIALLGNNDATVDGVTMIESPSHGVVSSNRAMIRNFKYVGWHSNNDAIRVGSGSEIAHCFVRAVDDHFYNFDIWVHDCVLWAGHNGAILTYGWGGDGVEGTYNSGASLLENIDIIHPEWISLGNNNSLVAAQTGLDYRPFGYGGDPLTVLHNIRIEGSIPGLVNLKPRSASNGTPVAVPVPLASVGYLGDLLLSNISVNAQFGRGRIRGQANAASNGSATCQVRNVEFRSVTVGGTTVTDANKATYLDIEAATTTDIRFTALASFPATPTSLAVTSPTASTLTLSWIDAANNESAYRVQRAASSTGPWTDLPDLPANSTGTTVTGLGASTTYHFRVAALNGSGLSDYAGPVSGTTSAAATPPPVTPPASSRGGGGGGAPSHWFLAGLLLLSLLRLYRSAAPARPPV